MLYYWPTATSRRLNQCSLITCNSYSCYCKKGKGSLYAITERRVPELIPVLGSQPADDVSHKPDGRLPLLSTRLEVTPATLKRVSTSFAAWWTEAQWVWTVCLTLLPDSVVTGVASRFEPEPFCAWVQYANHSATEPPLLLYNSLNVIVSGDKHRTVNEVTWNVNEVPRKKTK